MLRTIKATAFTLLTIVAVYCLITSAPTRSHAQNEQIVPYLGPIKGKVVLPDGTAAVKARVTLVYPTVSPGESLAETFTDASGEFAFENPRWPELGQPELKLIVEAENCGLSFRGLSDWKDGDVVKAEPATELRASFFQPMGKPATGVHLWPQLLVLRKEGAPSFVSLPPSVAERYKARTGNGGEVVIKGLPQGYQIRLAHDSSDYAKLGYGQQYTLAKASMTEVPPYHFTPGSSLSGKVDIATSGEPVAGVKVNAQEADSDQGSGGHGWGDTVTDKNGNYTLSQLTAGNYNLNVMLAGQMDKDWTSIAYDSTPLKVGEKRTGLDIRLIKGGLIVGTVKFSDGKPIPGTYVGVYGPARPRSGAWVQNCLTDKDGKYMLRVPGGANRVYLMGGPGMTDAPRDTMQEVTVDDAKETKIDFTIPR